MDVINKMILINPSYEILSISANLDLIEQAGRVCYQSEQKGQQARFIRKRIKEGHEPIIEHSSMTIKFTVDRGFTHELVRHRLVSYSQESTRWCNYMGGVTFIIPPWVSLLPGDYPLPPANYDEWNNTEREWFLQMMSSEGSYKRLLEQRWTPQMARTVLPNSLKTTIVATTNFRQWRLIFKQRALGTTGKPHPQMLQIMVPLLLDVQEKIPFIFEDLVVPLP